MESKGMSMNNIWSIIKSDSKKRNPLTNFVLYSIQIVSLVSIIVLLPDVFWSIGLLDDPDWNVWEAYGKGSIPAFFALISVFICNIQILKWKKIGFSVMLISFFIICIPLVICEYIEFVVFLGFMYGGLLIYWLSLLLKRKGISTWKQCLGDYKVVNRAIPAIAIFLTVILPPLIGYAIGFKGDLYSKGCDCLNAHLSPDCYYKNEMGRDIAFSSLWSKEEWSRHSSADNWFQAALHSAKGEYDNEWELEMVYSSYICFLLKEDNTEKAKKVYQEALEYVDTAKLRNKIEDDYILKSYLADYDDFVDNLGSTKKVKSQSHSESYPAQSSVHQDTKQHQESHQHYEPQPHTVYEDVWFPCLTCHGDGKCTNCNGRGGYYIGNYYDICGVCNGTGCCPWCGGRGQQMETRPKTVYY